MNKQNILKSIKNISKKDALNDYIKLRNIKCSDINRNSLIGNLATDYFFFKQRLETKGYRNISFYEFFNDFNKNKNEYLKKKYIYNFFKYYDDKNVNYETILYNLFRFYYGSINQFKPIQAKYIFCKLKPDTVLDFSCGWGGRCMAAMSLDINYIGFDTNINLKNSYKKMIETYPHNCNISIFFTDSSKVDYSKYDYDMVFTSPPYYKDRLVEKYRNMPNYSSREEFNEIFLFPVIKNTFKNLKINGIYALNIPDYMYNDIKTILGDCQYKIKLSLAKRQASKIKYREFIYIWRKT